jgi:hypothetical protein
MGAGTKRQAAVHGAVLPSWAPKPPRHRAFPLPAMLSTSARRALAPVAAGVAGAPSALPVLGASRILSLAVSRSFATSAPASADANILPARAASTSRAAYRPPSVNHVALDAISKGKTTGARFWNEGLFKSIGRAKGGLVPATAGATGAGQGLVPRAEQPEKKKSFDQLWAERSQMLQTQVQARDPYYGVWPLPRPAAAADVPTLCQAAALTSSAARSK